MCSAPNRSEPFFEVDLKIYDPLHEISRYFHLVTFVRACSNLDTDSQS